jgi:hypothetical protein
MSLPNLDPFAASGLAPSIVIVNVICCHLIQLQKHDIPAVLMFPNVALVTVKMEKANILSPPA